MSGTALITEWFGASPFGAQLGLKLAELTDGRAVVTLPFQEAVCTMGDVVHGGAIGTLIDTAATLASWAGAEMPTNARGSTVSLNVVYLAAARSSDLTATAVVLRRGKNLSYVDVDVKDASDVPVAKGLVTYKIG